MVSWSGAGACDRQLQKALLISAALHLLVLLTVVAAPQSELGEPESVAKKLQVLRFSTPRGAAASVAGAAARVDAKPARHLPVLSTPSVAAEPASSLSMAPPSPLASVERDTAPPIANAAAATPNAPAVAAAAPAAELRREPEFPEGYADALRGYRVALALQAKRYRLYPPAAQEMGLGGRSEIEVVLPASAAPELRIKKTSGHELLDQAALEMLRRSVGSVELPLQLKGRRVIVSLPVEFVPAQ